MARDSAEEENLLSSKSEETEEEEEEEEEDEALSLCDLPLNEENNQCSNELEELEEKAATTTTTTTTTTQMRENVEEFNFGSTEESEMCTADELFFKGQILPLRLSVSVGGGGPRRCLSRSESMDHGGSSSSTGSGSTSINTSRSSSTRSYHSSTTTNSANSTTSKQKIRNNFHSFPSPNPQIRVSSFRLSNVSNNSSVSGRTQKSTIWDLFRIGLVRAPEIEFQDLKLRSNNINGVNRNGSVSVSRNSSSGSSSNNSNNSSNGNNQKQRQRQKQSSFTTLFNLSGCNCSINAVEAVPLNTNNNNNDNIVVIKSSEEELKIIKKKKKEERKHMMSRHRTFEWLKELSHGSYVVVNDDDDDDDRI